MAAETSTNVQLQEYHQISQENENKDDPMPLDDNKKITSDIDLQNAAEDWKRRDKYKYHYHIIQLVIFPTFNFLWNHWVFSSIMLIWSMSIFITSLVLLCIVGGDSKNKKTLLNHINIVYGIADTSSIENKNGGNVYNLDRTYYGLLFLLFSFHTAISRIIYDSVYYREEINTFNSGDVYRSSAWPEQLMVQDAANYTGFVLVAIGFVIAFTSYYEVTAECHEKIKTEKEKLLKKYAHCDTFKKRVDHLTARVVDWAEGKYAKNRKTESVITAIVFCFVFGVGLGMSPWAIWSVIFNEDTIGIPDLGSYIFVFYVLILNAILGTICFFYVWQTLTHHYRLGSIIMDGLGLSLNCVYVTDLVAWWELRKYYKYCVVEVYSVGFSAIITFALITSFVSTICLFIAVRGGWTNAFVSMMTFALLYIGMNAFSVVTVAALYHEDQLAHSITINKERLRFKQHYKNMTFDQDREDRFDQEIIDIIATDIETNSATIKCLGVPMNNNVILFLRASALGIICAYISIQ